MVAIREHPPAPPEDAVDGLCDADREGLDPARKRHRVPRLDDEVQMIRLHGEVNEPESVALARLTDARRHHAEALSRSELRGFGAYPRRHVDRVARRERRSGHVWHAGTRLLRSTCAFPIPAPASVPEPHRQLPS